MAFRGLVLALLMLVVVPAQAATPTKQTLSFDGHDRTFYLFVPDGGQGPLPMVVLLHGSGGNGAFMISRWQDIANREHVARLAPDSLHTDVGWHLHNDGPDYVHAAIQAVGASHPID